MSPDPYACISLKKDGIPKSVKSHAEVAAIYSKLKSVMKPILVIAPLRLDMARRTRT